MSSRQAVNIALREIAETVNLDYVQDDLLELLDYEGGVDYKGNATSHPVQYYHDSKEVTLKRKANRKEKEVRLGVS